MRTTAERHDRTAIVVVLAILLVLAAAFVGGIGYLHSRIDANLERIDDPFAALPERAQGEAPARALGDGATAPEVTGDPVNLLILGSDSRISAGDPSQWRYGAQRTDAIMLVQVAGNRESVTAMSLPRDSWVDVPGFGMNKINAAFAYGGPTLMIHTVERLTGARVDHFAVADFEGFAALTDALGGVGMSLSQPLSVGDRTLEPGPHLLDGEQALGYVRERTNVPGGDFGRVQRQQNWIRATLEGLDTRDVLTDPASLMNMIELFTSSIAVDETFTLTAMTELAYSCRGIDPDAISFITAPYVGTGRSPDGRQSIVLLDEPAFAEVSAAFAEGRIATYLQAYPDVAPRLGSSVA